MAYTEANILTQIDNVIYLLEMTRQFGAVNAPNVITRTDTVQAALQEGRSSSLANAVAGWRNGVASLVTPQAGRQLLRPLWLELARVMDFPERETLAIIRRYAREMYNSVPTESINSRNMTHGSASAGGSNVGNGTIRRLVVNPYGSELENCHAEIKNFFCVRSKYQGANEGNETFYVNGTAREQDLLLVTGSGIQNLPIKGVTGAQSSRYLRNPSFSGSDSAYTGWTVTPSAGTAVSVDTTEYYRTYTGEGTAGSLKLGAGSGAATINYTVAQTLDTIRGNYSEDVPYFVQLAYKPGANIDAGTIKITLGSQDLTAATALAGGAGSWNLLVCTLDEKLYFQNWRSASAALTVTVSGLSDDGTPDFLYIDDIILTPMTMIDGTWFTVVGGATPFASGGLDSGDYFTFTDTVVGATTSYWMWQLYGPMAWLPNNNAGAETWADPLAWA